MDYSLGDLQGRLAADREARIAEFKEVAASKPYQDAMIRFGRVTDGFIDAHRALSIYTSRQPTFYENTLMYAFTDDFLESAVGIATGIHMGTHHAARRELRYMLENAV